MDRTDYQQAVLDEQLNGPTDIRQSPGVVLNPTEALPTGVGPVNVQPFQSGRSAIVRTTWLEQGWGHDSQRMATYPFSQGDNPARRKSPIGKLRGVDRQNFALDSYAPVFGPDMARQRWHRRSRRSGAHVHGAVVSIPDSTTYTDTVPAYGGGAVPHPGVDVPLGDLYPTF